MENSKVCLTDEELNSVSGGSGNPPQQQIPQYSLYRVKPGDCVSGIAWKFGLKTEDFIKMNDFENPDLIREGDYVRVPWRGTRYIIED